MSQGSIQNNILKQKDDVYMINQTKNTDNRIESVKEYLKKFNTYLKVNNQFLTNNPLKFQSLFKFNQNLCTRKIRGELVV